MRSDRDFDPRLRLGFGIRLEERRLLDEQLVDVVDDLDANLVEEVRAGERHLHDVLRRDFHLFSASEGSSPHSVRGNLVVGDSFEALRRWRLGLLATAGWAEVNHLPHDTTVLGLRGHDTIG